MIDFSKVHVRLFLPQQLQLQKRASLSSFYTFSRMTEVKEIIVVCDPSYKDIFEGFALAISLSLSPFFVWIMLDSTVVFHL